MWLVGGSPRYQLYPTKDGKLVACGAIEQKFWAAFTAGDRACRRNSSTTRAIRRRRATRSRNSLRRATPDEWRPIFAAADCCATIVVPLEEALRDPHFVERGLFAHKVDERVGQDHAGAAAADRAGVPRQAGREEGAAARTTRALRRASAAAARRRAPRLRASRRGATARCGRSCKARARARPAPAGNP